MIKIEEKLFIGATISINNIMATIRTEEDIEYVKSIDWKGILIEEPMNIIIKYFFNDNAKLVYYFNVKNKEVIFVAKFAVCDGELVAKKAVVEKIITIQDEIYVHQIQERIIEFLIEYNEKYKTKTQPKDYQTTAIDKITDKE
jgi:hypothetical protein